MRYAFRLLCTGGSIALLLPFPQFFQLSNLLIISVYRPLKIIFLVNYNPNKFVDSNSLLFGQLARGIGKASAG